MLQTVKSIWRSAFPLKWDETKMQIHAAQLDVELEKAREVAGHLASCREELETIANGALADMRKLVNGKK